MVMLMMAPASKASIYLGKMLGTVFFLLLVELFLMPIVELFFHAPILERFGSLIPILLLATIGYAAIGTLFSSMMVRTRLRDLLLGIILYPLLAPILIFAVEATKAILLGDSLFEVFGFITPLITIDVLYLVGGLWLFGPLMED
jgi:heme exporter protein B